MKWIYWLLCSGTLYVAYQTHMIGKYNAAVTLALAAILWGLIALKTGWRGWNQ
jgi:hypothetical protein